MATCDVGVVGAGVMGSNLALNIAEKGFKVALYNRTFSKVQEFIAAQPDNLRANLVAFESPETFAAGLKVPRKALILVPAGKVTDSVIAQLQGVFEKNDIIVDTGNAHFKDQAARAERLEAAGLRFLGMGISGGEEGARKGPAFFPGGSLSVWEDIRAIVEAAAAKAEEDGKPCVTMNGRGGAGSCVKMYHNAGEYAILQIWGEVFEALRVAGKSNAEIVAILEGWKKLGFLTSYMLDITIEACKAKADGGPIDLTDVTKDKIGSKGTGLWSAQEALDVGVPAPSLNMAVIARQLTMVKEERIANHKTGAMPEAALAAPAGFTLTADDVEGLRMATELAIIASYAQMFQCLKTLDGVYNFGLNLPATVATFRAGCILKGYLLNPMAKAYEKDPNLSNLLCAFPDQLKSNVGPARAVLGKLMANSPQALPVLTASLTYVNGMFLEVLRYGQVVSLQRDVFGRHGFERLDKPGSHNHLWPELQ